MVELFKSKDAFDTLSVAGISVIDFFIRIQSFKAAERFIKQHPHLQQLGASEETQEAYIHGITRTKLFIIKEKDIHCMYVPFGNGFDTPAKDIETLKKELLSVLDTCFDSLSIFTPVHIRLDYLLLLTDTSSRKGLWILNYLSQKPHRCVVYM